MKPIAPLSVLMGLALIGEDSGQPVTRARKAPFGSTGKTQEVVVEVK